MTRISTTELAVSGELVQAPSCPRPVTSRSRHISISAGAGTFPVMDDTLRLLFSFVLPALAAAVGVGIMKNQVETLKAEASRRAAEFDAFREADRKGSHEMSTQLVSAIQCLATATTKIIDFEQRRGEQIDRNTYRSRSNRTRIDKIESRSAKATARRLREHGVPPELLEDTSDVMERPVESSGAHASVGAR